MSNALKFLFIYSPHPPHQILILFYFFYWFCNVHTGDILGTINHDRSKVSENNVDFDISAAPGDIQDPSKKMISCEIRRKVII